MKTKPHPLKAATAALFGFIAVTGVAGRADATVYYWVASSASNWNTAANWNTIAVGGGTSAVPGSSDTATFTSSRLGDCTINATVNVQGMSIQAGYTGTISQGTNLIRVGTGGWTQAAGTFTGGTASMYTSNFTLTGGTFTATSGLFNASGTFNASAGTFKDNAGTLVLSSASASTVTATGVLNNLRIEDPTETNLVGYWKLDDTTGTSALDVSGSGYTATLANGAGWTSSFPSTVQFADPGALSLVRASSQYADASVNATPTNAAFSACAWVNLNSVGTFQTFLSIDGTNISGFFVQLNGGTGRFNFTMHSVDNTTTAYYVADSTTTVATGTWYHLCGVFTGSVARLYVNGTQQTGDVTVSSTWNATGGHTIIGAGKWGTRSDYTDGYIDDARIYNTALSATQIASLAAGKYANTGGASTFTLGSALTANGALSLDIGTLDVSASNYVVKAASLTQYVGSFTRRSGTVVLGSSADSTISIGAFNNLRIEDPTESNLVGYWKLDETQGVRARDWSGNGYAATLANGATWSSSVPPTVKFYDPGVLKLSRASSQYADASVTATATNAAFSACAWVNLTSTNLYQTFLSIDGTNVSGFFLQLNGAGLFDFAMRSVDSVVSTLYEADSTTTPVAGTWYHLCGVYTGSVARIYVNGSKQGPDVTISSTWSAAGGHTIIGAGKWSAARSDYVDGYIDDVRIYNTALSATQVAALAAGKYANTGGTSTFTLGTALTVDDTVSIDSGTLDVSSSNYLVNAGSFAQYAGAFTSRSGTVVLDSASNSAITATSAFSNLRIEDPTESNLVGYWKLDETQGTSAHDWSGSGYTATLANGATWSSSVPATVTFSDPGVLRLSRASSQYADASVTATATNAAFSACAWVNLTSTNLYQTFVSIDGTNVSGFFLQLNGAGLFDFAMRSVDSVVSTLYEADSTTTPSAGTWYHLCGVYTGSVARIYVNGSKQGPDVTISSTWSAAGGHTIIGAGKWSAARSDYVDGYIDDVRIYNTALSATQVAALAAGRYANTGGTSTFTAGSNLTVNSTLAIDSGTLATSSYTVSAAATDSTKTAYVNSGTLSVGSNSVTLNGGFVVQSASSITEDTTGGSVVLGAGKTGLYQDTAGVIEGFPTASFDWNTFSYWRTYVSFRTFSGSTDRLLARSVDGGTKYYWDLPAGVGSLLGAPRWNMESSTHYVYLVTTLGRVYKLKDDGTQFTVEAGWPYFNTGSATASSPLVSDSNNLYWCGLDSGGVNNQLFSLTLAGNPPTLNGTSALTGSVTAAPTIATISSVPYIFTAHLAKVYETPVTLAAGTTSSQPTTAVNGRVTVAGGRVIFPEDNGKIWSLSASNLTTGGLSYQDTNATNHPGAPACSAGNQCEVMNLFYDLRTDRIIFGDKDGHLYSVTGSTMTAATGYPWRPGTSSDVFATAPVYLSGVIAIGAVNGNVYIIDQNNGTGPALIRTYALGSAVSSISINPESDNANGDYLVGTASGKLYYMPVESDPTPGSI